MTRRKKIVLVIFLFLLAMLTACGLYVYKIYASLTSAEQLDTRKLGVNNKLNTDIVNVALFGVDGRDDPEVEGDRSDSIMIGTLDPVTKSIKVTSVMRDTFAKICYADKSEKKTEETQVFAGDTDGIEWEEETKTQKATTDDADNLTELDTEEEETEEVETEKDGEDTSKERVEVNYENKIYVADYTKINAAYNSGGVQSSIKTLNENFDLNIQDYVTVDFNCLMDIVDILGGITVNIPNEEVLDWTNKYLMDSNNFGKRNDPELKKLGEQTVTGAQALAFVRNRYSDSDFGRAQRQREVVAAILEKAKSIDTFTAINLVTKIYPYIKTSFTLPEIVEYTRLILDGSSDYKFESFRVPTNEYGTSGFVDQIWYLFPDTLADNVVALHEFIYGKEKPFTPSYTVEQISQEIDDYLNYSAYDQTEKIGEEMDEELESAVEVEPENKEDETEEELETQTDETEESVKEDKESSDKSEDANTALTAEKPSENKKKESETQSHQDSQGNENTLDETLSGESALPQRELGLPELPLNHTVQPLTNEGWPSEESPLQENLNYSEDSSSEWDDGGN